MLPSLRFNPKSVLVSRVKINEHIPRTKNKKVTPRQRNTLISE